jgi:hypothetical protein
MTKINGFFLGCAILFTIAYNRAKGFDEIIVSTLFMLFSYWVAFSNEEKLK